MLNWFRLSIPEVRVNNFTTDWNDGVALQYVNFIFKSYNITIQYLGSDHLGGGKNNLSQIYNKKCW